MDGIKGREAHPADLYLDFEICQNARVFGCFDSPERKLRAAARNGIVAAEKIYRYRRDRLTAAQADELWQKTSALRGLLAQKADGGQLKPGIESLEDVLRRTGGRIYPATSLVENIEFLLAAAIVILGFQAYFIRNYEIPTNSMWPSYYGMTGEVFRSPGEEPGPLARAGRFLCLGAWPYHVTAPASGEAKVLVFPGGRLAFAEKSGRKWLFFPARKHDYAFQVGGVTATLSLPADFEFDRVVEDAFGLTPQNLQAAIRREIETGAPDSVVVAVKRGDAAGPGEIRAFWVPLGKSVRQGEKILSFDLLSGDRVFVDRFSYNFVRPKVGQGFVFRTNHLSVLSQLAPRDADTNLIKRLVGVPGDRLEVKAPGLYRNGRPITGAAAFAREANREGAYPGYANSNPAFGGLQLLRPGSVLAVPAQAYFAMGDNSPISLDGRYWGFVPAKDVIGTPLFIYYPFTRRWGFAK